MANRKIKIQLISALVLFVCFLLLIVALKSLDVQTIGPESTKIGLATLNGKLRDFFGVHLFWRDLTDRLGIVAIFTALGFAVFAICEIIKRKSFKKVDSDIYILFAFYVAVVASYVFFKIFKINYRPILLGKKPEASFPSFHTMIVLCIMGTAISQFNKRIKNKILKITAITISVVIIAVTVAGRMVSGVHWFTDILGGLLLGCSLIAFYETAITVLCEKQAINGGY